ncbi:MAG: response regulator [Planctomycetota bacterium]|jgi:DNA-binding NtrC family response regulator
MKEKILVIDHFENMVFLLKTILSEEGYDVSTAYDYNNAMEEMARTNFELVLTDVNLGADKTGIDILKEVKKSNPTCPVIINTANRDYMVASDAKLFGAYDYMLKPMEKGKLLHSIHLALSHGTTPDDNANIHVFREMHKI